MLHFPDRLGPNDCFFTFLGPSVLPLHSPTLSPACINIPLKNTSTPDGNKRLMFSSHKCTPNCKRLNNPSFQASHKHKHQPFQEVRSFLQDLNSDGENGVRPAGLIVHERARNAAILLSNLQLRQTNKIASSPLTF